MRVATVQFCPTFKDKLGNLQRLARLVMEAAQNGAKLVVLPELCTTGYSFMSSREASLLAESYTWLEDPRKHPSSSMAVFYSLCQKLEIAIVFGYVEIDLGTKQLHNSQLYIEPSGFYASYAKVNRWGSDFLWCKPGISNPPVIHSQFGPRIGMLICRDVRDKRDDKWREFYSPGDADIVCLSTNWGDGGFPAVSWMDFVSENRTGLIVSNRYGQEGPNDFGEGGVCVITQEGAVLCEGLVWSQDCIVYAEV